MSKIIYLAGRSDMNTYSGGLGWREDVISELAPDGYSGFSPMERSEDALESHDSRGLWDIRYDTPLNNMAHVQRSDLLLCNLLGATEVSIETMIEYGWATSFGKPIVTISDSRGNIYEHPMIKELSRYRVETLDEAIGIIRMFVN